MCVTDRPDAADVAQHAHLARGFVAKTMLCEERVRSVVLGDELPCFAVHSHHHHQQTVMVATMTYGRTHP